MTIGSINSCKIKYYYTITNNCVTISIKPLRAVTYLSYISISKLSFSLNFFLLLIQTATVDYIIVGARGYDFKYKYFKNSYLYKCRRY